MAKLTKIEYILKAAKLYGLAEHEIKGLERTIKGETEDPFIMKRNAKLFSMYEKYSSKDYNERMQADEEGIINLDDYYFIISKRRLLDSKIGNYWVISSNLDSYLVTDPHSQDIKDRFVNISEKNNFLLPQLAKQLDVPATVYYKAKNTEGKSKNKISFMTKDFIQAGETLIPGTSIYKRKNDKRRVNFEALLEATDKYIKRYAKKNKMSEEDLQKTREDARKGLIKQTIFNKIVFNDNENNSKWGLIAGEDKSLRLSPLFSFDYCAGSETTNKSHHRVIYRNREDIDAFISEYGTEDWFKDWIREKVIPLDIDKAIQEMTYETGVSLTDEEEEYYKFSIEKMYSKVIEAYNRYFPSAPSELGDEKIEISNVQKANKRPLSGSEEGR